MWIVDNIKKNWKYVIGMAAYIAIFWITLSYLTEGTREYYFMRVFAIMMSIVLGFGIFVNIFVKYDDEQGDKKDI